MLEKNVCVVSATSPSLETILSSSTKMSFLLLKCFPEKSGLTVCQNYLLSVIRDISLYINRIRMFVCLSVWYTLLIKPNSIHMLYMGRNIACR